MKRVADFSIQLPPFFGLGKYLDGAKLDSVSENEPANHLAAEFDGVYSVLEVLQVKFWDGKTRAFFVCPSVKVEVFFGFKSS